MSANAVAFSEHLQPYSPTLAGSVSDPRLGTGATLAARWGRVTDAISYYGRLELGLDPDVESSGTWQLSLPVKVAPGDAGEGALLGKGRCETAAGDRTAHLIAHLDGSSRSFCVFDVYPAGGGTSRLVSGANPWSWQQGDFLVWRLDFEGVAW